MTSASERDARQIGHQAAADAETDAEPDARTDAETDATASHRVCTDAVGVSGRPRRVVRIVC